MWLVIMQIPDGFLKIDGYDDCVVGIVTRFGQEPILCYNYDKILTKLMEDGMDEEEAIEYFEYNIIGAYMGELTPCFIDELTQPLKYKDIDNLIELIKKSLSIDLLKPNWREKAKNQHHTFGHCYVASEVLYHLLGGKKSAFRPYCGKDENGTHWWLVNTFNGDKLDVTEEQYTSKGKQPPYESGKRSAFLTSEPSKRAKILMDRINVI